MIKNKTLLVVESPTKAKSISKYLGPDYIVRASFGHIKDLASGGKNGIGIDIENDFKLRYHLISSKKDIINSLIDATSLVKEIIVAGDPDREGSSISADLIDIFASTGLPIKRAIFNAITKKSILEGLKNAGSIDQNIVDAAHARRCLDRLCGYLVSPFIIDTFGPNLSAGRVQSVAVRICIDREREIEVFKPDEYWNIISTLANPSAPKESFQAKYVNKTINKTVAEQIKKDLETGNYVITAIEQEEKKKKPFPPLITTTLTTSAISRYKFPAAKTMKLAQSLFENGLASYHRTDDPRLPAESIANCREYLSKNSYQFPAQPNQFVGKNASQGGHPAIQPIDIYKLPQNVFLSEDEQKIYQLIWERYVASQMNPAVYDTVSVIIKTSDGHILKASGKTLKSKGWLEITGDYDSSDDGENKLPLLKVGDKLVLVPPKVKAEQKTTQPPPRFNEKTLIEELEKKGIGRPSTYAAIMSKITDRNYVTRKGNTFIATDLGKSVVDELVKYFDFMEYKYTSMMEENLDKIAEGKTTYLQVMNEFYKPFSEQLRKAYSANKKDYGFNCEKCHGKMELKHGMFGFYMACLDYHNGCRTSFSCDLVDEKPVKREKLFEPVAGIVCPKCSGGMCKKDGKFGPFYSCISPKCHGTRKVPFGKKCSDCGGELYATIYSSENVLFCMNYPNCFHKEKLNINIPDPKKLKTLEIDKNVKKILNLSRKSIK